MRLIKACVIAFSMYSKIPMPQFAWTDEDMKYALCFFPWIGAVIGATLILWEWLCRKLSVGYTAYLLIGAALPVLITGGFHVDGYMDTMDAIHSYQSKEKKLEILKDSHIGAFSVIMLLLYYLIYIAAFSEIRDRRTLYIVGGGFILSRALSGISVVTFQPARDGGMLRMFSDRAAKKKVRILLMIQILLCAGILLRLSLPAGTLVLVGAAGSFLYYRRRSYLEFGGVTGDTSGYFVLLCEAVIMIAAAAGSRFI